MARRAEAVSLDAEQVGRHNADLSVSSRRIIESGSWKQQRIVVVIPAGKAIPAKVYLSHCGMIFPPNQGVFRYLAIGAEVGEAYERAVAEILAHPVLSTWEYLLTLEHDNMPPADGVLRLVRQMEAHPEYACIGGLYWTKGEGGVPQIWGDIRDPVQNFRPVVPVRGQVIECYGTGMGFNLWRLAAFRALEAKKVPHPWFKTVATREDGVATQDLFFWGKVAKPNGWRCAIDCDCLVGHYDAVNDFVW